jgi:hypothetical protein
MELDQFLAFLLGTMRLSTEPQPRHSSLGIGLVCALTELGLMARRCTMWLFRSESGWRNTRVASVRAAWR